MSNSHIFEEKAIKLGMIGTLGMAVLGFGFSILTQSEAILLDGLFSLINFIVTFLSLHVSRLIRRPDDQYYPFGYAIFEPIFNMSKGLLMLVICIFALVSAISAIVDGGYPVSAGIAIWYALIAATGCMAIAVIQRKLAQKSGSPLLEVDAKSWFIDGLLSGAVALGFIIVMFVQKTPLAPFTPYADPTLVIILVLAAGSMPIGIIKSNWYQVVGRVDESNLQAQVLRLVNPILETESITNYHIRQGCLGRLVYVQFYFVFPSTQELHLMEQDRLRTLLYNTLRAEFPYLAADFIFTTDPIWLRRAITPDDRQY
ncbi:cation diffusion facilitator family transporter [Roseofilum capinflatum]|uniref:Cation transporter n=1 Tax=Roseofilum capinflatum BLCC-M114 TaxID=3022440 RepID=A0ABT7B8R0_9CYAN|nr:cation transporter [Roseofilum capinflatum]MDJ1175554.1 cation transporter [Roseofilum capinflatum BLCC-M114]